MNKMTVGGITMPCSDAALKAVSDRDKAAKYMEPLMNAATGYVEAYLIPKTINIFEVGERSPQDVFADFLQSGLEFYAREKGLDYADVADDFKEEKAAILAAIEKSFEPFRAQIESALRDRMKKAGTWADRTATKTGHQTSYPWHE